MDMTNPASNATKAASKAATDAAEAATKAATTATAAATSAAQEAAAGFSKTIDETTERIRALNEKIIEAAKQTGNLSLDTYEKTLGSLLEFEEKVGNASQLDWVAALSKAHASFISEVSNAYTSAA